MILEQAVRAAANAPAEPNFWMYAAAAAILVVVAVAATRWMGRTIKKDLDPNRSGKMRSSMAIQADSVPTATVKEALAKGLVTSQQLATMSPVERQYLFASLAPKLSGAMSTTPVLPLKPTADQIAALGPPPAMAAASPGAMALSESDGLKVHCPWCGTVLALPASPPYVVFCDKCGAKTAVRTEDQGRIIMNSAPPGVARRPIG